MTGDASEAEDLAQETFVIAIEKWHAFQGRSSHSTWLYGILIRLRQKRFRSLARMRRRLEKYIERSDPPVVDDPQIALSQSQWRESVWSAVAKLPVPQRDAVTLRYAEGLSYEQIAEVLGCACGTAKTRVHHGLKRLRNEDAQELQPPRDSSVANVIPAHR